MSRDFTITHSTDLADPSWDRFLQSTPQGQFEQTSGWARVKARYGWHPIRVTASRNGEIAGGFQVLFKPVLPGCRIGYVSKGPVLSNNEGELLDVLTSELKTCAKRYRIQYLVVHPPDEGHKTAAHLAKQGLWIDHLVGFVSATTVIDLRQGLDEIFANMSKRIRPHIRRGEREGVRVREGSATESGLFFPMMLDSCRRQGVTPNPPDEAFFSEFWRHLHPYGEPRFFFAEQRGKVLSGAFTISFRDVLRLWKIGWTGSDNGLRPNHVLHWEMIKWAKAHGYRRFDFVGIKRPIAEAVLEGRHYSEVAEGPSFFKLSFGGDVVLLPEAHSYVYNPAVRLAYTRVYPKVSQWHPIRQGMSRLAGGAI